MPRQKPPGAPEPKRRSRFGCHACKRRKVKCDEQKPSCNACIDKGEHCDYSIVLQWEGRHSKKSSESSIPGTGTVSSFQATPSIGSSSGETVAYQSRPTSSSSATAPSTFSGKRSIDLGPPSTVNSLFGSFNAFQASGDGAASDTEHQQPKRRKVERSYSTPAPIFTPSPSMQKPYLQLYSPQPPVQYQPLGSRRVAQHDAVHISSYPAYPSQSPGQYPPFLGRSSTLNDVDSLAMLTPVYAGCPASIPSTPALPPGGFQQTFEHRIQVSPARKYGFDQGREDLDIPRNDDRQALVIFGSHLDGSTLRRTSSSSDSDSEPLVFGFGMQPLTPTNIAKQDTLQRSNYYVGPVVVYIPAKFEPLPVRLSNNPMNILYFHHFLNHTARCLVPHDCPENAFRTILPEMALKDANLLNLLLAYSASHRARLLKQDLPRNRIAQYVHGVFRSLSDSLSSNQRVSDETLASSIMMASVEIVSPHAFEIPVSWTKHLSIAREMILKRGGYQALRHGDKASYFLSRWFAYLDVLGSLSGGSYERPLTDSRRTPKSSPSSGSGSIDSYDDDDIDEDDEIDCFLGFTGRCIAVLAEVANLAKDCDQKRRHMEITTGSSDGWTPGEDEKARAEPLIRYLSSERSTQFRGCSHRKVECHHADNAVNAAFHHAGLIHLYRRVLAHPISSAVVQSEVKEVRDCLDSVEDRSVSCMIFPVFTAGCEAINESERMRFLNLLKQVEKMGMAQARCSREVMEKVWRTGQTWWEVAREGRSNFMG